MPKYEVITLNDGYRNYTYFENKTSAFDYAVSNKPSKVLVSRRKVKEFK